MMRSSDDYNKRDSDGGNQDSGKAVALQAPEYDEAGLPLNMHHRTKTMNFISQYPSSTQIASGSSFKHTPETGKSLFTDSQWQEFESQKTIFKHIMSSIPVPAQSNRSGRFSVRSDPEPWRCRRTDGKKWRCSRDVVPDQKYCERHAHKTRSRTRSRKLVEATQSHRTIDHDNYHPTLPTVPSMATSCQQSRCTDWFMKSGIIPLSSSTQKIHKPMDSHSPSVGLGLGSSKRDHFHQQFLEGTHQDLAGVCWSRNRGDVCSLSLSMQSGGDATCSDQDFFQMDEDKGGNVDVSNPGANSWLGGPLGEALCPRVTRTLNEPANNATSSGSSLHDRDRGLD